jgi:hypothetical protein
VKSGPTSPKTTKNATKTYAHTAVGLVVGRILLLGAVIVATGSLQRKSPTSTITQDLTKLID